MSPFPLTSGIEWTDIKEKLHFGRSIISASNMLIRTFIMFIRKEQDLTQEQLAEKIEVRPTYEKIYLLNRC